ncbi:MAG: tetratricopeptide repeat protein [Gammaproteobacteria bacterium]|nr:tetratricopeptide repeat protein [Gammaproteobacteria bacterium]
MKYRICILLTLSLAGCSTLPTPPEQQPQSISAADTLLAQANSKAASGETAQAIAILERAVRLQPRNAHAWLRLAELYLTRHEYRKAEQFAGRAAQFAAGDQRLIQRSKALIKQANERQHEQS